MLAVVPLVVLALDLALFQRVVAQQRLRAALDATSLFESKLVQLGTINSVSLTFALEKLNDDDSLAYLSEKHPSGLVISVFVDPDRNDGERLFEGEISRAIRARLRAISENVHQQFLDAIARMRQRQAGDVLGVNLQLSNSERERFPVDRLIIVALKPPDAKDAADPLAKAISAVIADAESARLKSVALPSIGYQWNEKKSPTLDHIFRSVFNALKGSHRPFDLYVSLYSNWHTADIEKALEAVNAAWSSEEAASDGLLSRLYRGRYRILLLFTSICLFACTRKAENTMRSFFLIVGTYVGTALGLAELIGKFTQTYPQEPVEIAVVISWLVLALGFPVFVGWDIAKIFHISKSKRSRNSADGAASVPRERRAGRNILKNVNISLRRQRTSKRKAGPKETVRNHAKHDGVSERPSRDRHNSSTD